MTGSRKAGLKRVISANKNIDRGGGQRIRWQTAKTASETRPVVCGARVRAPHKIDDE